MKKYKSRCSQCNKGLIGKYRLVGKLCATCSPNAKSNAKILVSSLVPEQSDTLVVSGIDSRIDLNSSDAFYHSNVKEIDPEVISLLSSFHYWRRKDDVKAEQARLKLDATKAGSAWGTYSWKTPVEGIADENVDISIPLTDVEYRKDFSTGSIGSVDEDIVKRYTHKASEWLSSLTVDEINAVTWWTSNGSGLITDWINGKKENLWDVKLTDESVDNLLKLLDSAIDKSRTSEPVISYRGGISKELGLESESSLEDILALEGSVIEMEVPKSTSLKPEVGVRFMHSQFQTEILMEFKSDSQSFVGPTSAWALSEVESLVPAGGYKVIGVRETQAPYGNPKGDMRDVIVVQLEQVD